MIFLAQANSDYGVLGAIVGIVVLLLVIAWIIFPVAMINFAGKQREANRLMLASMERLERQLEATHKGIASVDASLGRLKDQGDHANAMHAELNRAAQWFIDQQASSAPAAEVAEY